MSASDSKREYMRARYHRLKDAGLCVECGKLPAVEGSTKCLDCRERSRERCRKSDAKRTKNHERQAAIKRLREGYLAKGLCYQCGKRPHVVGKRYCQRCINRAKINSHRAYMKKTRFFSYGMRKELGICLRCNEPVVEGYCFCEKHLEEQRERAENARVVWRANPNYKARKDNYYKWTFAPSLAKKRSVK